MYTTFKVEHENDSAYAVSSLEVIADDIEGDDIDDGYLDTVKAVTNIYVSDNPRAYWCYEANYIGYSLV